MTFVEDEDDVPGVDGVPAVALDEGRELLDGGDDDGRGRIVDLLGELACGLVGGDGSLGEGVIFADGLMVEVLAVNDEENPSIPAASFAVLKEVRVFPEPVVCQTYPPAATVPVWLFMLEVLMRWRIASVAAIW